jgi:hypothetical protein
MGQKMKEKERELLKESSYGAQKVMMVEVKESVERTECRRGRKMEELVK